MDRRVTPPKRVTSPTWGPLPPCKQALKQNPQVCVLNKCVLWLHSRSCFTAIFSFLTLSSVFIATGLISLIFLLPPGLVYNLFCGSKAEVVLRQFFVTWPCRACLRTRDLILPNFITPWSCLQRVLWPQSRSCFTANFCYLTLKSVYWTINKNSHWYIITYTHKPVNLLLAPLFNPPPLIHWTKRNLSWIMIHSADRSYWPITTLTLHVDWFGMFNSPDFRTGSWDLSNRAARDDFQLPMLDIFHLAFPLVIHRELNQTTVF